MKKKNKENYIDKIPVINSDLNWTENNNIVTIHLVHKGIYSKLAQKFFHTPKESDINLDEFGSFIWTKIDGESSIYEIGKAVKEKFGKKAEPLYERLTKYFYILNQEKYISFKKTKESLK